MDPKMVAQIKDQIVDQQKQMKKELSNSSSVSDQSDGEDYSDDSFDSKANHNEDLKNRTPLIVDDGKSDSGISKDSSYSSDNQSGKPTPLPL